MPTKPENQRRVYVRDGFRYLTEYRDGRLHFVDGTGWSQPMSNAEQAYAEASGALRNEQQEPHRAHQA